MDISLNGVSDIYNQIFEDEHPKYDDILQSLNLDFVFMYIIPDDGIVEPGLPRYDIPLEPFSNNENDFNPNRN